jgi:hypothetical protein
MLPNLSYLNVDTKRPSPETDNERAKYRRSESDASMELDPMEDFSEEKPLSRERVREAFESGEVLFDAFGSRGVVQGVSVYSLRSTAYRYGNMEDIEIKSGTFNDVAMVGTRKPPPEWVTSANYGVSDTILPSGFVFRWTRNDLVKEEDDLPPTLEELLEEVYLTLYAAKMGVGPPVQAIAVDATRSAYPRLYMMSTAGSSTRSTLLSNKAAQWLTDSCERTALAGLLLLDVKIQNTTTVDDKIMMIDFGADHAIQVFDPQTFDISSEEDKQEMNNLVKCLQFMIMVLLVTNMRFWQKTHMHTTRNFVKIIEKLDLSTSATLCKMVDMIYLKSKDLMCFRKSDGDECHKIDTQTYDERMADEDYKKIVISWVFMLRHYVIKYISGSCSIKGFQWRWGPDAPSMMSQLLEWVTS